MLIELTTIFLLFLIMPGYAIKLGVVHGCRFDLKASPLQEPYRTIQLLAISALFIGITFPVFSYLGTYSFNIFLSRADFINFLSDIKVSSFIEIKTTIVDEQKTSISSFKWGEWLILLLLYFLILLTAYCVGRLLIFAVERGILKTDVFHGSLYHLISGKSDAVIWCSILTKHQHKDCYMMYRGVLSDISYSRNNKIDYVCLKKTERLFLKMQTRKEKVISTEPTKVIKDTRVTFFKELHSLSKNKSKDASFIMEDFIIDGEDISNILFSRLKFKDSNISEMLMNLSKSNT